MPARSPLQRVLEVLARWPAHLSCVAAVFLSGVVAQEIAYATFLKPIPTIASGYAASTALGLLHGRGLTVRSEEAEAWRALPRDADALPLYDPAAPRGPAHEPLPGTSLLFAAVAAVSGTLRQDVLVHLQILLHALGAVLLTLGLRERSGLAALAAGLGWALFVPQYRSTLVPGYDSLTSLVYIGAVLAAVRYVRGGGPAAALAAGIACGAGLWIRDYLFVLPILLLPAFVLPARRRLAATAAFVVPVAAFVVPVAAFAFALAAVRAPESGATNRFVRGGVWHSFWAGVGQFDNPAGVTDLDVDVRAFAARLAPGEDFDVPNYQYLPAYGEALASAVPGYVRDEWPSLLRNAGHRLVWLVFPSFAPSRTFAAGAMRIALIGIGVPLSLAALVGLALALRREPLAAWVLASPLVGLLPLVPYYFVAKVPIAAFFVQLAFAGLALDALRRDGSAAGPA